MHPFLHPQVMATGGKSYPKLGTDGAGWDLLTALGHRLKAPYPALTPLTGAHPGGAQLAGALWILRVYLAWAAGTEHLLFR